MRALVVDDEKNIRKTLGICLDSLGCEVTTVGSVEAALSAATHHAFNIAFVDVRLGTQSGIDLIQPLLASRVGLSIVMITAYSAVDTAVAAMRFGAVDYLEKPLTVARVREVLCRYTQATQDNLALTASLINAYPDATLHTASMRMRTLLATIQRVARHDASVLLLGESGSGKGMAARLLHDLSPRQGRPMVTINCPTLSENMLVSELFGHIRGAFTGAVRDQPGRIEFAHGGTLFLDEVADMSLPVQAQLLRFLQERCFERVGEHKTRSADVRIIAATNRDLKLAVQQGSFREDLLYRLNVIELCMPSLRHRCEDIVPLAKHFLRHFAQAHGQTAPDVTPGLQASMQGYPWPGNLRELRNAMERAIVLGTGSTLSDPALVGLPPVACLPEPALGGDFALDVIEKEHIRRVLSRYPGQDQAAAVLEINASTLWRKRKRYEQLAESCTRQGEIECRADAERARHPDFAVVRPHNLTDNRET